MALELSKQETSSEGDGLENKEEDDTAEGGGEDDLLGTVLIFLW